MLLFGWRYCGSLPPKQSDTHPGKVKTLIGNRPSCRGETIHGATTTALLNLPAGALTGLPQRDLHCSQLERANLNLPGIFADARFVRVMVGSRSLEIRYPNAGLEKFNLCLRRPLAALKHDDPRAVAVFVREDVPLELGAIILVGEHVIVELLAAFVDLLKSEPHHVAV